MVRIVFIKNSNVSHNAVEKLISTGYDVREVVKNEDISKLSHVVGFINACEASSDVKPKPTLYLVSVPMPGNIINIFIKNSGVRDKKVIVVDKLDDSSYESIKDAFPIN